MALTILEGSTFCICDERGDVGGDRGGEEASGLFAEDTRFLSLLRLSINGERPLVLSSGKVEYFSAAFYLRNPLAGGLAQDSVSIFRERFVGDGMQDRLTVENLSMEPVALELALEIENDFADIMSVKDHDFALGDPLNAQPLPPAVEPQYDGEHNQFVLRDSVDGMLTQVILSQRGEVDGGVVSWQVELEPRQRWELRVDVIPAPDGRQRVPRSVDRHFGDERSRVRDSLSAWQLRVPQIRATWDELGRSFSQSVADLAALRMRGGNGVA